MKKVFIAIAMIFIVFIFSGCGTANQNQEVPPSSNQNQNMTRYETSLTLDNYLSYFEIQTSVRNYQPPYVFKGCLSYAFYDNVCVYFEYTDTNNNTKQTEILKLNAAGNGDAPFKLGTTVKLVDITGTVTFWI